VGGADQEAPRGAGLTGGGEEAVSRQGIQPVLLVVAQRRSRLIGALGLSGNLFQGRLLLPALALGGLLLAGCATAPYMEHYERGLKWIGEQRTYRAIYEYRKAIQLKPDFAEAHFRLGEALFFQGRIGEAIVEYYEAVRLKPELAEDLYMFAGYLDERGRRKEARLFWEKILKVQKNKMLIQDIKHRLAEPD